MRPPTGRGSALTVALPVALLMPEVINVGFMFIRWDHLFLAFLAPAMLLTRIHHRAALTARSQWSCPRAYPHSSRPGRLSAAAWGTILLIMLFSAYQLYSIADDAADRSTLIKYALAPVKALAWSLLVREMFRSFRLGSRDLYRMVVSTAAIVFGMQLAELTVPSFRAALFSLYPVAESSHSRLAELAFRARGPFGGYDAASMFFAIAGVVIWELRARDSTGVRKWLPLAVTILGAFLAARTGFVLLIGYLVVRAAIAGSAWMRVAALGTSILLLTAIVYAPQGEEGTLTGRYLELAAGLRTGDLTGISSVYGTIYMNESLAGTRPGSDPMWGAGLDAGTTADQLYAKYYFMLGAFGVGLWCTINAIIALGALRRCKKTATDFARQQGVIALIVAVMIAIGHWKGGNYYFASRLGDYALFLSLLGLEPMTRKVASSS